MILGQSTPKSGVIYYEKDNERFKATRLADRSNTLALPTRINSQGELRDHHRQRLRSARPLTSHL